MQVTTQAQGTRTDRVAVESGEHSDQAVNTADEGLGARIARPEARMMDVRERLAEINGELRTTTVALDALQKDFRALAFGGHSLTAPPQNSAPPASSRSAGTAAPRPPSGTRRGS